METWIIVLIALGAAVVLVLFVDCVIKCRERRKKRKYMRNIQLATIREQSQVQIQNPYSSPPGAPSLGGDYDPRIQQYPANFSQPNPNSPMFENPEIYGKQMPYNPSYSRY